MVSLSNHDSERFVEDTSDGPFELIPGLWIRRPGDQLPRGPSIVIDQGDTFGSGTHPTTSLAVKALAARLSAGPVSVLDVGCGSGILALCAAKLKAAPVVAIDNRLEAARRAAQNARANKLEVKVAAATPAALRQRYDLVLANIWVDELIAIAAPLAERVAPGGFLFATGAPLPGAKRMVNALVRQKLKAVALEAEGTWAGALFLRS